MSNLQQTQSDDKNLQKLGLSNALQSSPVSLQLVAHSAGGTVAR